MPTCTFEPETREVNGKPCAFVSLAGHLDEKSLAELGAKIEPILAGNHLYLVLDLGELDLVSSRAVSYLESLHRKLAAAQKRLAFINANEEIREILEFIGLAKLVTTFEAEENFWKALDLEEN
ncbi:MAG: STAS domain-containing protein [Patescibacteria group bacterium]